MEQPSPPSISSVFHFPKLKLRPSDSNSPSPPPSLFLAAAVPFSISMNGATPGASYTWNLTTSILLRLAYFIWYNLFSLIHVVAGVSLLFQCM